MKHTLNIKHDIYNDNDSYESLATIRFDNVYIEYFDYNDEDGYIVFKLDNVIVFEIGKVDNKNTCSLGDIDINVNDLFELVKRFFDTSYVFDLTDISWTHNNQYIAQNFPLLK